METDEDLLRAWRQGDQNAGEELVRRHYPEVKEFFTKKIGTNCEDLIQETFLGCLHGLGEFRAESSFSTYLLAIAGNKYKMYLRAKIRAKRRFSFEEVSPAKEPREEPEVFALLDAREEHRRLLACLRHLSSDEQVILELHYWEGHGVREIAEALDMPVGTLKSKMRSSRKRLAAKMAELVGDSALLQSTLDGRDLEHERKKNLR